MTSTMDEATDAAPRVLIWVVEGTWQGCVDGALPLLPAGAAVTLLHVAASEVAEAAAGALAGLLGRGRPGPARDPAVRIGALAGQAASDLLAAAAARLRRRLGPDATIRQEARAGRVERVVIQTAEELAADLLVAARDGDRSRLGPASLGPATRFVVDHAPCPVLLVWPDPAPAVGSIPPPPPGPPHPPPHRPAPPPPPRP